MAAAAAVSPSQDDGTIAVATITTFPIWDGKYRNLMMRKSKRKTVQARTMAAETRTPYKNGIVVTGFGQVPDMLLTMRQFSESLYLRNVLNTSGLELKSVVTLLTAMFGTDIRGINARNAQSSICIAASRFTILKVAEVLTTLLTHFFLVNDMENVVRPGMPICVIDWLEVDADIKMGKTYDVKQIYSVNNPALDSLKRRPRYIVNPYLEEEVVPPARCFEGAACSGMEENTQWVAVSNTSLEGANFSLTPSWFIAKQPYAFMRGLGGSSRAINGEQKSGEVYNNTAFVDFKRAFRHGVLGPLIRKPVKLTPDSFMPLETASPTTSRLMTTARHTLAPLFTALLTPLDTAAPGVSDKQERISSFLKAAYTNLLSSIRMRSPVTSSAEEEAAHRSDASDEEEEEEEGEEEEEVDSDDALFSEEEDSEEEDEIEDSTSIPLPPVSAPSVSDASAPDGAATAAAASSAETLITPRPSPSTTGRAVGGGKRPRTTESAAAAAPLPDGPTPPPLSQQLDATAAPSPAKRARTAAIDDGTPCRPIALPSIQPDVVTAAASPLRLSNGVLMDDPKGLSAAMDHALSQPEDFGTQSTNPYAAAAVYVNTDIPASRGDTFEDTASIGSMALAAQRSYAATTGAIHAEAEGEEGDDDADGASIFDHVHEDDDRSPHLSPQLMLFLQGQTQIFGAASPPPSSLKAFAAQTIPGTNNMFLPETITTFLQLNLHRIYTSLQAYSQSVHHAIVSVLQQRPDITCAPWQDFEAGILIPKIELSAWHNLASLIAESKPCHLAQFPFEPEPVPQTLQDAETLAALDRARQDYVRLQFLSTEDSAQAAMQQHFTQLQETVRTSVETQRADMTRALREQAEMFKGLLAQQAAAFTQQLQAQRDVLLGQVQESMRTTAVKLDLAHIASIADTVRATMQTDVQVLHGKLKEIQTELLAVREACVTEDHLERLSKRIGEENKKRMMGAMATFMQ